MSPLRFCFVTTFYPPYHFGGDAVFVYRLAEALAARGHKVDVLHSLDAYHVKTNAEPASGFTHHPNVTRHAMASRAPRLSALSMHQLGRPAAYGKWLTEHFAQHEYDVVHFHNSSLMGAPGVFSLARKVEDAVTLYTAHEYWLVCPTHVLFKYDREACTSRDCVRCTLRTGRPPQLWRYTGLMNASVADLDAIIMPSHFAAERHGQDGINAGMTVMPHFVPVPDEADLDVPPPQMERPYFLFAGRLEKLKGVQDLLRTFADYRDADLLIVGTGGYEEELRTLAKGLPHVRFAGALHPSEIGRYYRHATAVLMPSLCYEVFPLIGAEALAHGTPVIGRRIGAVAELIETTGGGLAFDTLEECREAMQRLLADRTLRDQLGRAGRAHAAQYWTVEAHLAQYFALIGSLKERRENVLPSIVESSHSDSPLPESGTS